jgi:hypothetical protein
MSKRLALSVAVFLLTGAPLFAQLTRGVISGTVRDTSGAVVPGATVTATNVDTNQSQTTVTDKQGFFRVPALEPGAYRVEVAMAGFARLENKRVEVRAALDVLFNAELKPSALSETLDVTAETPGITLNRTNPTVGLTTLSRQVIELPLSADRNPNNLIGMTQNVVSAGDHGQGTYAVNGQRTRNNNYMIDGSDNNDISVTISTTQIVPESVAEFQVQTNPFSAEFGRSSGAQINVITKSGTNRFHGQLWEYYRNNKLASLTNIEKASSLTEPAKYTRHQAGLDIGGPILKDRTFFYALYQYDADQPDPAPGASVRIPTPAGWAALQSVPLGAGQTTQSRTDVLSRLSFLPNVFAQNPTFRSTSSTLVNGIPVETGLTNINIKAPSTYHTLMARIDHRFGTSDRATVRYYLNKRADENAISNCAFGATFCGKQDLRDTNLALSETHIFNPNLINEFRFSLVKRDLDFPENDPKSPTATISGLFTIGGSSNYPQSRITNSYQFSNTLSWTRGRHALKLGADVRYNDVDNVSAFNSKGTFVFNSLQDYMNNLATTFDQALQTASWHAKQWQTSFFIQDDFRVTPELTLNAGLRYELAQMPLGMLGAKDQESLAAMVPGEAQADKNNWAPRVGFAWSPSSKSKLLGDGKTVVRGGFGMGYDVIFYNLLTVNASNYPRVVTPRLTDVQNVYPNLLPVSGAAAFNALATYVNSPVDTQSPDSKFWSLSVAREVGDFVVEVGYNGSRGYHGVNQIDMNPGVLTAEQAAAVAAAKSTAVIPSLQLRRVNPLVGSRIAIPAYVGPVGNDVEARSTYRGVYVSVNKRLSHGLRFGASYTYGRMMSDNDGSLGEGGTTNGSSQRPQNCLDYSVEWSVSQFDRPHRFVINYQYEIPGPKSGPLKQILGGWQFSGITSTQSGRPFTIGTGVDSNGDGTAGSDRPNINSSGTFVWDSQHRTFTNNGYYVTPLGTNNLPLAYAQGDGNSPRNSQRGPGFWNTNLSLSKRFDIGERALFLRIDGINVFNQDDCGNPVVSMASPSFGQNTNNWGRRIFVLGAKFAW